MSISEQNRTLNNPGGSDPSLDITHTISAGTDVGLFVVAWMYDPDATSPTISSMVWDSAGANESLTNVAEVSFEFVANRFLVASVWRLENPTPGATKTITVTKSEVISVGASLAITYEGVDQTTMVDASSHGSATGNSQNPSKAITTDQDNSWVVGLGAFVSRVWGTAMSPGTDVNELEDFATGAAGGDRAFWAGYKITTTAGSTTVDASTAIAANDWLIVCVEVVEAVAAAAFPPTPGKNRILNWYKAPILRM